jgi:hypothetical protein
MVLPRSAPVPFGLRVEQEEWEEREVEVLVGSRCAALDFTLGGTSFFTIEPQRHPENLGASGNDEAGRTPANGRRHERTAQSAVRPACSVTVPCLPIRKAAKKAGQRARFRMRSAACITGVTGLSLLPFLLLTSQQGRSTGTCHTARQEIETRPKTE